MRRAPLAGLLLASCAAPPPSQEFTIRVGVPLPLGGLSPSSIHGSATAAADLVYEPLLRPGQGGKTARFGMSSRFLERWAPAGSSGWRLQVASGARFSDASPVLAEDVAQSLREWGFAVAREGESLLATAPRGQDPLAALLAVQVFRRVGPAAVGTGPFELVEQKPQRILLRRRQPQPRRPQTVEFVAAPTTRELFAMLLRGELGALVALDHAQEELLQGIPTLRVLRNVAPNAVVVLFNPARLTREQRAALQRSLPLGEIGRAGSGPGCREAAEQTAGPLPPGPPLQVGYVSFTDELRRTALALRRALGTRGGDVTVAGEGEASPELGLLVTMRLVWPPAMLRASVAGGSSLNAFGYANRAFDAAVEAGDEAAADAALRDDPPLAVVCRRERRAAVDARFHNATLGEWGALETLPEWELAP